MGSSDSQASERKFVVVLDDLVAIALFNGGEIDRGIGRVRGLVIEMLIDVLRNLLADGNAAGVVTDLRTNLIIGLGGIHRLFPSNSTTARVDLLTPIQQYKLSAFYNKCQQFV